MLSEEAKPQIAERSDVGCSGYDIWWAHINALRQSYTWWRQKLYGEERCVYEDVTDSCVSSMLASQLVLFT